MSFRQCPDPECKRPIPEEIFDKPSAHAVGCKFRRQAERAARKEARAEQREKFQERGRKAAATRAQRKAEGAYGDRA